MKLHRPQIRTKNHTAAPLRTSLGECEIYILEDKRYTGSPVVEHGDWNKHYSPRYV